MAKKKAPSQPKKPASKKPIAKRKAQVQKTKKCCEKKCEIQNTTENTPETPSIKLSICEKIKIFFLGE